MKQSTHLYQHILDELQPPTVSQQFYRQTKFVKPVKATPASEWPESWKKVFFKSYPRFPKLRLPQPLPSANLSGKFIDLVSRRRTHRSFANEALSLAEISTILQYSVGIQDREVTDFDLSHRMYPSGGARFPVEVYFVANVEGELPAGLYHYHFQTHSLEVLKDQSVLKDLQTCFGDSWVQQAPYFMLLTSVFFRTEVKYQDRGLRHSFLEAGHISQNVYLVSLLLNLGCSALGGFAEDETHQLLGIEGEHEGIIHALAIGKKRVTEREK